jgi:hypothetical protein
VLAHFAAPSHARRGPARVNLARLPLSRRFALQTRARRPRAALCPAHPPQLQQRALARTRSPATCSRTGKIVSRTKLLDRGAQAIAAALQTQVAAKENRYPYGAFASGDSLYNYFRDYDPALGRYLQPDAVSVKGLLSSRVSGRTPETNEWDVPNPAPITPNPALESGVTFPGIESALSDLVSLSLYAYVNDSPLTWIDVAGLAPSRGGAGFQDCIKDCNYWRDFRSRYLCPMCGRYAALCRAWSIAQHTICVAKCQSKYFPAPPKSPPNK